MEDLFIESSRISEMFSFLKNVVSSVVPWRSDSRTDDLNEQEQHILDCIRNLKADVKQTFENATTKGQEQTFGQCDLVQFDVETVKCVHKSGTVTNLSDEYGLIDNVFYFEFNQVSAGLDVKINDEVLYSAYKIRDNEAERVRNVYALKNDSWDSVNCTESLRQSLSENKEEQILALTRFITGRVAQRRGRKIFIDSANVWCDLDMVQSAFVPVEGDWVELKAVVSLCEDTADLSGDVLMVKSLKPSLKKTGTGRITFWSDVKKEGAIENLIYFTYVSCEEGYAPALGDEVTYDAVESDQERFKWRALKVLVRNIKFENKVANNDNIIKDVNNLFCEKNGISIMPNVCVVEVELNESKTVTLEVKNNGIFKQQLKSTKYNLKKDSQLVLLSPRHSGPFIIGSKKSVLFRFQCKGRHLGLTREILYFYFENFTIAKSFEISVVSGKEMNQLLECKFGTVFKTFKGKKFVKNDLNADVVFYGPKPWNRPKFFSKERRCVFNIPKKLWSILERSTQGSKNIKPLLEYAPYLKQELNFYHYADWFHTLLYLEEIELRLNFRQYDMNGVFLRRSDNCFVLEVSGLAEKRPSLIIGDRIVLSQPWTGDSKTKNVGYIHDIQEKEIFVKFHTAFHESYDESECDIVFEPNTIFFSRCHEAINRSIKALGADWLFPSAVNKKLPQIDFDISEEMPLSENTATSFEQISQLPAENKFVPSYRVTESESDAKDALGERSSTPYKKKLVWVNQNLNGRQKLAIANVLKGEGRPLPYIIFGPPGTGKTVTLVEIVIQIYRLMPESRILIATPSNSSADLICERLIEFGKFKPGQLVRLVALYRVLEGLVPEKLIPFSTFFAGNENGKNFSEARLQSNIRSSNLGDLAGRHRITVATSVTIGVLHYSGFPPGHFTHILLDEAGQISEPEALIATSGPKKIQKFRAEVASLDLLENFKDIRNGQVVLTGDPQQLGPVVHSKIAKMYGLGVSLLQRLISTFPYARDFVEYHHTSGFDPRFITKLNVNYRTVPEILSLPSQLFYNSDLFPTVSQTVGVEANIIKSFNFETEGRETPPSIIFDGVIGQNYQEKDSPSWFNPHEVWQVVFYVRKLYFIGLKNDDIGIVSPYAKQVQKLRNLLLSLGLSVPKIGSVEEFQGQERHVIIVSTVRSSPKYLKSDVAHTLGFVASPQRLNVALTRARALLIIVGNPFLLSRDPFWINVVRYCLKNGSYTGCSLDSLGDCLKIEGLGSENGERETGGTC